ncbi:MAG: hypothetical protein QNJ71_11795 [Acidimicrobiia bacterium]|nr:hypothetical protein [Acidimicrobiia bacterium]
MNATRLLGSLITSILVLSATASTAAADDRPSITTAGATAAEVAMVDWAVGRFAQAGLSLPDLRIEFPGDPDGCFGFAGTYNHELGRILMCNRGEFRPEPHQTLLHELVHAWASTELSLSDLASWTELRELESWDSRNLPWWQRGEEQAAEIVSWGLLDDNTRLLWLLLEDCNQLRADFTAITGAEPLNTSNASCKDDGTGNRRSSHTQPPTADIGGHHDH